jgi:hypothetical protein
MVEPFQVGGSSWWYTEYRPLRPRKLRKTDRPVDIRRHNPYIPHQNPKRMVSASGLSIRVEPSERTMYSWPALDKIERLNTFPPRKDDSTDEAVIDQ